MTTIVDGDRAYMQRCLELAKKALGRTAPNPLVGAVIVKAGAVMGEGFHPEAGKPHAEVFALRQAGDRATGATLYVNLEPCSHYGRTPPCADAIIAAGIQRVVIGMVDPNPLVAGQGVTKLQQAGLEVAIGIEEVACQALNEAFVYRILHQRPFGILKYAMTLDGKIATSTGHSAWVTGTAARQRVHHLRSACDAIIVGGNTVRQDNPHLTTHGVADHNPLRIVLSPSLNLPAEAHLWQTQTAPTLIFTEPDASPAMRQGLIARGVEVVVLDQVSPAAVMQHLYDRGCMQVLWECGGRLAAKAIDAGAVQKVWAFIAPKIIGGIGAPSPVGELGLQRMTQALRVQGGELETIGDDWLIQGYLSCDSSPAIDPH
jgi:diaminohydroxyphosphoribosylaminopyrimidine deaminase / 5-amino-6-(5-phosphoribosylamino)uracil reductase